VIKKQFYEELQIFFNDFPKCHMESLLGYFNAKCWEKMFSD